MSNYLEYNDKIAFHPGYYIKELIEESGLTQEDFAKRLGTTPKNISYLVRGEQSLSIDIAMKLSRMLGTTVSYWLNLQKEYDALSAEFKYVEELEKERNVFAHIDYNYFKSNFGLPDLPRKVDEQIKQVREFLKISTLELLKGPDLAVSFRSDTEELSVSNIINANAMVQIAINMALKQAAPKFNKQAFYEATTYALSLTTAHEDFYPLIRKSFLKAGVIFVILPNLKNSGINGATKKIGDNVLLLVNDRRSFSDTFWFTLFHEIGHIMNGDYGMTMDKHSSEKEDEADIFAQNSLIPPDEYKEFVSVGDYSEAAIRRFADKIKRDPGIVFGRLLKEEKVLYTNVTLAKSLRHKYKIKVM